MKKIIIIFIILGLYLSILMPVPWLSVLNPGSDIIDETFNHRLSVQLPSSTKVIQNAFSEREQLQASVYLNDQKLLFRGYLQLWQLDNLENYLDISKRMSTFDFESYSLKPYKTVNFKGYIAEWTAAFGDIYRISGKEYWFKKTDSNEVLRISFFTDSTSFSSEQLLQINKIIESIQWN